MTSRPATTAGLAKASVGRPGHAKATLPNPQDGNSDSSMGVDVPKVAAVHQDSRVEEDNTGGRRARQEVFLNPESDFWECSVLRCEHRLHSDRTLQPPLRSVRREHRMLRSFHSHTETRIAYGVAASHQVKSQRRHLRSMRRRLVCDIFRWCKSFANVPPWTGPNTM